MPGHLKHEAVALFAVVILLIYLLRVWFQPTYYLQLPSKFDFSRLVPQVPIYYQSTCGSCWANATVTALQFRAYNKSILSDGDFDIDDVIQNTLGNNGCAGGSIRLAYKHASRYGLLCKGRRYKLANVVNFANTGIDTIKRELLAHGPISAHVHEYPSMRTLKRGTLWEPMRHETLLGGHAVVIYGWDDGMGGWLVQNSWGVDWCDSGKGVFKFGAGKIESLFVYAGYF